MIKGIIKRIHLKISNYFKEKIMKKIKELIELVLVLFFMMVGNIIAQESSSVPTMINYQGFLTDETGTALNGNYQITFRLYDEASGENPWVWVETHNTVAVENGLFNVLLGSIDTLTAEDLAGERYLEIKVGAETEMTPRMRLASAAYSMRSDQAMHSESAEYASNIIIQGEPAFRFKRYWIGANMINADYATTFTTEDWAAAIVGFNAGWGDINEDDGHELWEVRMKKDYDEYWHIVVEAPTHSNHPDWTIDVMFVRMDLASMEGYSEED
jgi:hypothetical protein